MTYPDYPAKAVHHPNTPPAQIIKVHELLADSSLAIPHYQRPYKWTGKNINQLFSDINIHKDKSAYRLGTVVIHQEDEIRNIVDGQQRTISLLLAARALLQRLDTIERNDLRSQLLRIKEKMINPQFTSEISHANIHNNYLEIDRIISRESFTESHIDFFLNRCEVVLVTLSDVSEAFQFFDSQNARGRDLEPHDLLKAYHLREFSIAEEGLKASTVELWEKIDSGALANLFSNYLYRIRSWSKGMPGRYFTKDDVGIFKGVNIDLVEKYPYVEQLRIAHYFIDQYNAQYERKIDANKLSFPFHLDQIIVNGRRFFEMIHHYQRKVESICEKYHASQTLAESSRILDISHFDGYAKRIMKTLNEYPARCRTGDRYVRLMFDCLLIYYIDKFGQAELSRAIEKIFIWAYTLRLQMQVVQLASMDNYVLQTNLFWIIKEATAPADFVNISLPVLPKCNSTQTKEIEGLFRDMKYHE